MTILGRPSSRPASIAFPEASLDGRPAGRPSLAAVLAAGAVAVGVVLRFWSRSDLWLDEALSVNIARLPLARLPEALREDGAPPLYYALLHGWMQLVGTGDVAVRALSGLASVASLPLMWLAARRLGGRTVAWPALAVLASSPFAVHYATETRMYALVVLLTLLGCLAVLRALELPTRWRLACVAAVTAALVLTHYWSAYLVLAVALWLVRRAVRGGVARRAAASRCLAALAVGCLAFLPWLPVFVFQARRTGTPWGHRPTPAAIPDTIVQFAGGFSDTGAFLAFGFVVLALLAVFARPLGDRRIELDLRGRRPALALALVVVTTLAAGVGIGWATGNAFTARYASVVLAPFLLLVSLGVAAFSDRRIRHGVVGVTVALGTLGALHNPGAERTQARPVAAAITSLASPGDVVAYCPDQLGPAVHRVLPSGYEQLTFPDWRSPERVNWVDYAERHRAASPRAFARELLARAGDRDVFVVWSTVYRGVGQRCRRVVEALEEERTGEVLVERRRRFFERMTLTHFPAR